MGKSRRIWVKAALPGIACAILLGLPSLAQDRRLAFEQVIGQPRGLPQLPPQGAWGEVINVTSRWIVIQNHSGQQYPIALDDVGEFLVRWPSSIDRLGPQTVVEAVGRDVGSNVLQVSHVDAFEGGDRTLVAPTYNSMLPNNALVTTLDPGFNRLMNAWDYAGQNMLYGWAYPVRAGITQIPSRLHIVGTVVQRSPLQLSVPGNNFATVVSDDDNAQFTVTQVTRGSITYARKGDYVFLLATEVNPRGLVLSQLVLYKSMPFRQFNPNAR